MTRAERMLDLLEKEYDRLKASNAELLEAVEYLLGMVEAEFSEGPDFVYDAIARAKGDEQ